MAAGFDLPRRMIDAYNGDIDELTRDAVAELRDFLSDYDLDEMDLEARERLRDDTIEELNRIIEDYGDASASIGADFYEAVLDAADIDGVAAMPSAYDSKRVEGTVRRCASSLFGDDADLDKYADGLSDFLERAVSHRADECAAQSAVSANEKGARKGKKGGMKFARVPSGPSCGFCIMLASRGFVYATRKSAGEFTRFHNKCDCRIVEGYDGMHVEGYDPEALYERYKSCRDTIRADVYPSPVRQDWERLSASEKAKYYDPRDPERKPSYNQYLEHRIAQEMETRDRQWLYDGIPCYRTKEPGAKPLKKERDVGTALLGHGFNVEFIKEVNRTGIKTADALLNGEIWEFKIPEGWNPDWTVKDQFFKSLDKGTDKLLISNTLNGVEADEIASQVCEIFDSGDYPHINEVLVYDGKNDRLVRIKRWGAQTPVL